MTVQGAPAFYTSETLYQYIDGAADIFQLYDVQAVLHRELKAGDLELTADIFDLGNLENSFGMYSSERSPSYDFVTIGAEGYRNEGILNFFQDRYYVKLAAFGAGADPALEQFATALAARIGLNKAFPTQLSMLPAPHRKARSEQYIKKDPLGHSFLSPIYQAVYTLDQGERTLAISVAATPAEAESRMKALAAHFRGSGQWTPAPQFGDGASQGTNSFEGSLVAATNGRYLLILLNPPPNSAAFFKDAAGRFR